MQTKARVALWDNARFLLILLVVVGHLISTIRTGSELGFALYNYIYLFHMPAMLLLAGMFSKAEVNPRGIISTVQLFVIWVTWELIWALIKWAVNGQLPGDGFLVNQSWSLWFLVSLASMRIILPYLAQLRWPFTISVILALLAPLLPTIGTEFSAARTLAFLPFFVAGWAIKQRGLLAGDWFMQPSTRWRLAGWGVLAGVAAVFIAGIAAPLQLQEFWRIDTWLTNRDSYLTMLTHGPIGGVMPAGAGVAGFFSVVVLGILTKTVLGLVAFAMTLALLLVVSRKHSAQTVWGARTLYVYLLHGVIVWFMRELGVITALENALGIWAIVLLSVAAIPLTMLLSSRLIVRVFGPIIEPKFGWITKPQA